MYVLSSFDFIKDNKCTHMSIKLYDWGYLCSSSCAFYKLKKQHSFMKHFATCLSFTFMFILIGHLIHAIYNLGQPGSEGIIVYNTNKKYNTNLQIMCYTWDKNHF